MCNPAGKWIAFLVFSGLCAIEKNKKRSVFSHGDSCYSMYKEITAKGKVHTFMKQNEEKSTHFVIGLDLQNEIR